MYENEFEKLTLQLRQAREKIFKLVEMHADAMRQRDETMANLRARSGGAAMLRKQLYDLDITARGHQRKVESLRGILASVTPQPNRLFEGKAKYARSTEPGTITLECPVYLLLTRSLVQILVQASLPSTASCRLNANPSTWLLTYFRRPFATQCLRINTALTTYNAAHPTEKAPINIEMPDSSIVHSNCHHAANL